MLPYCERKQQEQRDEVSKYINNPSTLGLYDTSKYNKLFYFVF